MCNHVDFITYFVFHVNSFGCSGGMLLSFPSSGMDQPWCFVSTSSSWSVCHCHISGLFPFLNCFFHTIFLFYFFSRAPWSITAYHSEPGQELGLALLQVPFELKYLLLSRVDRRTTAPEALFFVLLCCPGRCVLVMNLSFLTFTNWLSWWNH